jgi:hypothetical protein
MALRFGIPEEQYNAMGADAQRAQRARHNAGTQGAGGGSISRPKPSATGVRGVQTEQLSRLDVDSPEGQSFRLAAKDSDGNIILTPRVRVEGGIKITDQVDSLGNVVSTSRGEPMGTPLPGQGTPPPLGTPSPLGTPPPPAPARDTSYDAAAAAAGIADFPGLSASFNKKAGDAQYNVKFDVNNDDKVDFTDFLQIVREADSGLNGPPPGQGTPPPGYETGHNLVVGMNEALASKDPGRVNEYKKWLETLNPEQLQANLQNPVKSFDMWDGMTSGTPPSQQGDQRLDALYARAAQLGISIEGLTREGIQAAVRAAEEGGSTDASRLADRIAASGVTDEMLIERFGPGGDGSLTNPEIELNSGTREWWINKYQKQQANLDAGLNLDGTNRQFTSGERLPSDILANAKPEEIIAGILTHRDRGYSDDLIRQSMVTAGFTPEQIDQGFLALGAGTNGVDPVVSGTNGVDPVVSGTNCVDPVVSGTNGVDPVVSGTNGATDTEDIFTPDDLSTTPDPDFQGLGDTGDILADLTDLLRNRLNTTGLDAIGERDLADFLELRGRGREQSIEELNRLGLYDLGRGAGASQDVLGTFDTGTSRGRLDIFAQAQKRRDEDIDRALRSAEVGQGDVSLGLQEMALFGGTQGITLTTESFKKGMETSLGSQRGDPNYSEALDLDGDGAVSWNDVMEGGSRLEAGGGSFNTGRQTLDLKKFNEAKTQFQQNFGLQEEQFVEAQDQFEQNFMAARATFLSNTAGIVIDPATGEPAMRRTAWPDGTFSLEPLSSLERERFDEQVDQFDRKIKVEIDRWIDELGLKKAEMDAEDWRAVLTLVGAFAGVAGTVAGAIIDNNQVNAGATPTVGFSFGGTPPPLY